MAGLPIGITRARYQNPDFAGIGVEGDDKWLTIIQNAAETKRLGANP